MRMAVESLSLQQQNQQDTESDKLSSCDSGVSSRFSTSSGNGYYPGKIAERMERDYRSSLSNYPSSLSSGRNKQKGFLGLNIYIYSLVCKRASFNVFQNPYLGLLVLQITDCA